MNDRRHDPAASMAAVQQAQSPKPLPKRFYEEAATGEADGAFRVLLDGRPIRTPGKNLVALPTRALAEAIAAEWQAQREFIDPITMPMSRIVNSALDGVRGREREVAADIVRYAGSDLICYRAPSPRTLAERQSRLWNPIAAWAEGELGCRFVLAEGVMHVAQSEATLARFGKAIGGLDALGLASLHVMTTLLGSALLAYAHAKGRLTEAEAWSAAHVDEDFQIEQWGPDAEAEQRRRIRAAEFAAASRTWLLSRVR